jgi:hypothetical protein
MACISTDVSQIKFILKYLVKNKLYFIIEKIKLNFLNVHGKSYYDNIAATIVSTNYK